MQSAEIYFWRFVNPLMDKSAGVRRMMRRLAYASRPVVKKSERVLGSTLDILFLAVVILCGCVAFGCGYLIGLWLG